jgi:hypothetical protein
MPNWCSNSIKIKDLPIQKVYELVAYIKDNDGRFFQWLRPRPKDQDECWYDWNCEYWGTKWDACFTEVTRFGVDYVNIVFESAWAPPLELYYYMYDNGYKFVAEYSEPMMGFAGIFEDGLDMNWDTLKDEEEV